MDQRLNIVLLPPLPEHELDGSARKAVGIPDLVLQISRVGEMHQFPVVHLEAEQRRLYAHLRYVVDLQPSALVAGRIVHHPG